MSNVDLFVPENLAASDHNKERREATKCWLHDRADEGMG